MNTTELIVLEYSPSQNAFHRHTVKDMMIANITAIGLGQTPDYIPVAVVENYEQADEVYQALKGVLRPDSQELSSLTIGELLARM